MWWTTLLACSSPTPPEPPPPAAVATAPRPKARRSSRPKEKPCLPPPSGVEGDRGAAASAGLSEDQIRVAMEGTFGPVAACAGSSAPSGTLLLSVTVGCGGVVTAVEVQDAGDWPPDAVSCAREVVRGTAFPAHALPDGETFGFPYRMR